jgi:hippurate hydrolase
VDSAVITVGSIHGGTKSNVIPDEVKLQLTVRSLRDEVQKQLLDAIARVARGEAAAAGAPREPTITPSPGSTRPTVNDPRLAERLRAAIERGLGASALGDLPPIMGSEDFSEFGWAGIPAVITWVGAARDADAAAAAKAGAAPGVHTARFAPVVGPTLRTGASTLTLAALEVLARR